MTTLSLTDTDRAVFTAVANAAQPPGTIVRDFDALLGYLATDGVPVSPKNCEFAIARLPELNALLTHPAPIGFSRGRQISYPQLDGLHLLLRFSRLAKIDRSSTPPRMVLNTERAAKWRLLNPTERYFSLLEQWWRFADCLYERGSPSPDAMAEYRWKLLHRQRPENRRKNQEWPEVLAGLLGIRQIALMQLFGLLDILSEPAVPGAGWKIKRMVSTPWGLAASATYLQSFAYLDDQLEHVLKLAGIGPRAEETPSNGETSSEEETTSDEEERLPPFFVWAKQVIPFFPAWKHFIGEPEPGEPFRGSVTFKVSLDKDTWRRIVMPAQSSFDDLARFILEAFKFDDDHLYQFRYQDEYANQRALEDPRCSDAEDDYADSVSLGEIGLYPKQLIEFRFDFGDDWRFEVLVEKLEACENPAPPAVVAKQGKAPRQYR